MKANLEFLADRFDKFNHEIFRDELPRPQMHISSARSFMGQFKTIKHRMLPEKTKESYHLTLSDRYDLDIDVLEDVVIHEMIHYFIHFKKIRDSSSHGLQFRKLMNDINRGFGRHITVSHRCSKEELESDSSKAHSIIC